MDDQQRSEALFEQMERHQEQARVAKGQGKCHACNTRVTVNMGDASGKPGLVYSSAGLGEYQISGTCETCFDAMFAEGEEE